MKRSVIAAAGLFAPLFVSGCVNVLPEAGPAPQIYRLDASSGGAAVRAAAFAADAASSDYSDLTVVVPEPLASRALSTDRVAVIQSGDSSLSYAAGARWSERTPRVVQDRVLMAFEDDGRVGAAVRPEDGVQTAYELRLDMIRFEAEYTNGDTAAPTAIVELRAKLIDRSSRDLVASARFDARREASENRMGPIIEAFDGAMAEISPELVDWTLTSAPGDAEPVPSEPASVLQPSASAASSSR